MQSKTLHKILHSILKDVYLALPYSGTTIKKKPNSNFTLFSLQKMLQLMNISEFLYCTHTNSNNSFLYLILEPKGTTIVKIHQTVISSFLFSYFLWKICSNLRCNPLFARGCLDPRIRPDWIRFRIQGSGGLRIRILWIRWHA